MIERSLEAKFPTIWTDGRAPQIVRSSDVEKTRDGESQKIEDAVARNGRKVAKHFVFHCFIAQEGRKVGLLKRRVQNRLAR